MTIQKVYTMKILMCVLFILGLVQTGFAQDPLRIDGNGKVTIQKPAIINNLFIGDVGYGANWGGIQHKDLSGKGNYALKQRNDGLFTVINTKAGGTIAFRIDNKNKIWLDKNGNVGIGVTNPSHKLQVNGNLKANTANLVNELTAAKGTFNGPLSAKQGSFTGINLTGLLDVNGQIEGKTAIIGCTRLNSDYTTINGRLYVGVRDGGYTGMPDRGFVQIDDKIDYKVNSKRRYPADGNENEYGEYSGWYTSLYSRDDIVTNALVIMSDERTKVIKGQSDSQHDLSILNQIEITDYQMKDVYRFGNRSYKKVIAQQVKEVYPQAIKTYTDEVPDIYQHATINDQWVSVEHDLKAGEKVLLIFGTEKVLVDVLETASTGFKVNTDREGEVFVYGREVEDFHAVDYDAIAMLNVSATQELAKRVEALEAKNQTLTQEMSALKAMFLQLQAQMNAAPQQVKKTDD
jgi:hypothetical protein